MPASVPLRRPSARTALRRVNVRLRATTASTDVIFILMRRMRTPLVVLILVFTVDVIGLTLMPGVDDLGHEHYMTVFESFYFMSYAASTIGFGEYPYTMTTAQRMWITVAIYSSVTTWAFALGTLISLMSDRAFGKALRLQRFARQVRQLREPFLIVAGFGQMGHAVVDALDARGRRVVVVSSDGSALDELAGGRLSTDVPAIEGDARESGILQFAGLAHPYCEGVMALTHDDSVNLSIIMTVRLLCPQVPVYTRADNRAMVAAMRDFSVTGIVNPLDRFGDYLRLRLTRPTTYQLVTWLLAPYDAPLPPRQRPLADGCWYIAADDHFGAELAADLHSAGLTVCAVTGSDDLPALHDAAGFVAGATDESRNLAMAAHARLENPDVFLAIRSHSEATDPVLRAFGPDSVFNAAQLTADEVLARVITPDFWTFFLHAFEQDESWSADLLARLIERNGERSPASRRVTIDREQAPGVLQWLAKHPLTLGDLFRHPDDREAPLAAIPLILTRGGRDHFLPGDDLPLKAGDEVVLAGRFEAMDALDHTLFHTSAVEYVSTGNVVPTTWLFRKLSPRVEDA